MSTVKVTTSISKEDAKEIARLRREEIRISDLIRLAVVLSRENPELFYAYMYRIKMGKKRL